MADFGGSELDAFRAEAREWIDANFPKSLANQPVAMIPGAETQTEDHKLWKQRMAEKGWGAPTWPTQYGGGGLSGPQARVLQQEMDRAGAYNPMMGMGTSMFGPTLLEYGTEDQKQRHIPPIVKGEIRWCQGYSEPGAGSDLASLQTKCVDMGDHWQVDGQKIWTSGAQYADWCFCLVRTDTSKKHEGISFVLINMHQPGVETRPIKLIAGSSPFCETFFTAARVEKNDMVGPLNGGWAIGKRLLQHERSGISGGGGAGVRGGGMFGVGGSPAELAREYV
ncbi:MAG: acyl-CoA dehydrogenase family protein, partial [Phenylobacterium sp.]